MDEFIHIWNRMAESSTPPHRKNRLKLTELNPHLICILCGGYYIDATTIVECLHTFCKTCIVGYLGMSKHCPACDTLVHKTKPLLRLRPDHTLQDLVYKLVPGLFKDEMKKRRNFYKEEIESGKVDDRPSSDARERIIYSPDEQISLALELSTDGRPPFNPGSRAGKHKQGPRDCRYLQCPASFTIGHLKKFIRMKFNLCERYQIDLFHTDEALRENYSLMDVAYIYSWRRKGPLRLFYTVYTTPPKKSKPDTIPGVDRIVIQEMVNDIIDKTKVSKAAIPKDSSLSITRTNASESSETNDRIKISSDFDHLVVKSMSENESETQKVLTDTNDVKEDKTDVRDKKEINSFSKTVDFKSESNLEKPIDEEKTETKENVVDECVANDMDTNEDNSMIESTTEKVIESTSDDSGNFSLEESFDNSMSDKSRSESDEKGNEEKTKDKSADKEEIKETYHKEKTDENMNSEEHDVHDEVFTETKTNSCKQNSEMDVTCKSDCEIAEPMKQDENKFLDKGEKLLENTSDKKAAHAKEEPSVSETVECSTSTSDLDTTKSQVSSSQKSLPKVYGKDDLVSEPIVSSTQNTQGCQTDEDETEKVKSVETSEKEDDIPSSNFDSNKLRIDVSCETENFEAGRKMSIESVSVSTDTEELSKETAPKRKSVDSATSTDIPYKSAKKDSIDSGTFTEFQEKIIKPLSPRKLSPNPAIMEAQPLSPTKITLKLTSPNIPVKRQNQSPSRSDPNSSTFLSKFESFVNELPDTSQDFEPPYATRPRQSSISSVSSVQLQDEPTSKTADASDAVDIKPDSSEKKHIAEVPVKRPRGRPPKNKNAETYLVTKHKSHKSRSSSPKHKKYERQKSESYALSNKSEESLSVSDCSIAKRRKHNSEKSEPPPTSQPQEKKIPKHFVLFSNGQYTLATENNISKFKQSSPLSPTRTVWDTVLSSYGDKDRDKYSKSTKSNSNAGTKKYEHKIEKSAEKTSKAIKLSSQDLSQPKLKPLKIMISEPQTASSKFSDQRTMPESKDSKEKTYSSNISVSKIKKDSSGSKFKTATSVSNSQNASSMSYSKKDSSISDKKNMEVAISKRDTVASKNVTSSSTVLPITVPSLSYSQSKELPTSSENKTIKTPEYRHQSPFFASLSGAKLTSPHRPGAHLNIPNINSHFAGTHYLYAQNSYRYTNDRLGSPSYRSLPGLGSAEAKPVGIGIGAITPKAHRDIVTSHSAIIPSFLSPLSIPSMLHLPATQPLPVTTNNSNTSPKGYSPDSTRSPIPSRPESHNAFNVPLNTMSNIKTISKQNSAVRKTKEKSIDNVISAITEMRAKKEISVTEQLTGMDLTTKNRNSPLPGEKKNVIEDTRVKDNDERVLDYKVKDKRVDSREEKNVNSKSSNKIVDKYAFTDDDDITSERPTLHLKTDHRGAVSDQNISI